MPRSNHVIVRVDDYINPRHGSMCHEESPWTDMGTIDLRRVINRVFGLSDLHVVEKEPTSRIMANPHQRPQHVMEIKEK